MTDIKAMLPEELEAALKELGKYQRMYEKSEEIRQKLYEEAKK